jgi:hypothetical protein
LISQETGQGPFHAIVLLQWWARALLLTLAGLLVGVFAIAIALNPYRPDGTARLEETHRQMGLPPCSFRVATGMPCPSCGMTTSFALLIRGDLWNSLRANAVGTLLGLFCLAFIPWAVWSAFRGELLFISSVESTLTRLVVAFLVLMLMRWGIVLMVYYG